MRPLEKLLEKLDDVRRKKLSELIGGSEDGLVGTTLGMNFVVLNCTIHAQLKCCTVLEISALFPHIYDGMIFTVQTSSGSVSSVLVSYSCL